MSLQTINVIHAYMTKLLLESRKSRSLINLYVNTFFYAFDVYVHFCVHNYSDYMCASKYHI